MTFTEARETLGNRDSKKIANNTYLIPVFIGAEKGIGVKLHDTCVVVYLEDRTIVRTGGRQTVTTKARINEYLPVGGIFQKVGEWFWNTSEPIRFAEGDEIVQLAGDYRYAVRTFDGILKGTF